MFDFIDSLKCDILQAMPDVCPDWAEYNAIIQLSTILKDARIIEQEKPLHLNLIMVMIAPSGIKKSLPMTAFTYPILKETGSLIKKDLILPSRSSVPGLIKLLNKTEGDRVDKDGNIIEKGLPIHNQGIMIRDEFSGLFKGMRTEGWQSDGMEFISEMYDGIFQKRATTTHGLHKVEGLYANLITCTTYYFLGKMDPEFFTQGTGNRILYCHYGADEYEVKNIDPDEYFKESWGDERKDSLDRYAELLKKIYDRNIKKVYIGGGGDIYANYRRQCETEWKQKCEEDPLGWDYYPIKRYPELALKLSAIYAISHRSEVILSIPDDKWDHTVCVERKHMERAIATVERNREHFRKIVEIKNRMIPMEKPKSNEAKAKYALGILANSPGGMLPSAEWLALMPESNSNKKYGIKRYCLSKGWVKIFGHKDIDEETRIKLEMESNRAQIVKYIKGL